MKDFVLFILESIVDHPEAVEVTEETGDNETKLTITVHPEDVGQVIGKNGRIIRSIRSLVGILASQQGTYCRVEVAA